MKAPTVYIRDGELTWVFSADRSVCLVALDEGIRLAWVCCDIVAADLINNDRVVDDINFLPRSKSLRDKVFLDKLPVRRVGVGCNHEQRAR